MAPRITQQINNQSRSSSTEKGIFSRIQSVADMPVTGIKLSVYGRGKTGKTRLACTFPKPLLLLGTEDGTKSIRTVSGVFFARLQNSAEVQEVVDSIIAQGTEFRSIALDTAGGLQDLILKDVVGYADMPIQKTWGIASGDDWRAINAQTKEKLDSLLRLADTHGLNIVIIAHERNFGEENSNSDVMIPAVGSAVSPGVAGWLNASCDYVCQTYIREGFTTVTTDTPSGKVTTQQPTGKKEYCLRVGPHQIFLTGFRLPPGRVLPDSIVNPSYDKIVNIINGTTAAAGQKSQSTSPPQQPKP